jgi:hypothetical protein
MDLLIDSNSSLRDILKGWKKIRSIRYGIIPEFLDQKVYENETYRESIIRHKINAYVRKEYTTKEYQPFDSEFIELESNQIFSSNKNINPNVLYNEDNTKTSGKILKLYKEFHFNEPDLSQREEKKVSYGVAGTQSEGTCGTCEGTKTVYCKKCHGTGTITCPSCYGIVHHTEHNDFTPRHGATSEYYTRERTCGKCHGLGEVDCPKCDFGKVICPGCNGEDVAKSYDIQHIDFVNIDEYHTLQTIEPVLKEEHLDLIPAEAWEILSENEIPKDEKLVNKIESQSKIFENKEKVLSFTQFRIAGKLNENYIIDEEEDEVEDEGDTGKEDEEDENNIPLFQIDVFKSSKGTFSFWQNIPYSFERQRKQKSKRDIAIFTFLMSLIIAPSIPQVFVPIIIVSCIVLTIVPRYSIDKLWSTKRIKLISFFVDHQNHKIKEINYSF